MKLVVKSPIKPQSATLGRGEPQIVLKVLTIMLCCTAQEMCHLKSSNYAQKCA